jgi:hypothetical protein
VPLTDAAIKSYFTTNIKITSKEFANFSMFYHHTKLQGITLYILNFAQPLRSSHCHHNGTASGIKKYGLGESCSGGIAPRILNLCIR